MTSDDKIERIARALCEIAGYPWEETSKDILEDFRRDARGHIAAHAILTEPAPEAPPYMTSGFLRVESTIMHPAPEAPAAEDDGYEYDDGRPPGCSDPEAPAAEAGRCEDCSGPLGPGESAVHISGSACRRELVREVERLRGELAHAQHHAVNNAEAYRACVKEGDAARAELARLRTRLEDTERRWAGVSEDREAQLVEARAEIERLQEERDAAAESPGPENACMACGRGCHCAKCNGADTRRYLATLAERDAARAEATRLQGALDAERRSHESTTAIAQQLADAQLDSTREQDRLTGALAIAEQMLADARKNTNELRAQIAHLRAPQWTKATRDAVEQAARKAELDWISGPRRALRCDEIVWRAVVAAYLAALTRGAAEGER